MNPITSLLQTMPVRVVDTLQSSLDYCFPSTIVLEKTSSKDTPDNAKNTPENADNVHEKTEGLIARVHELLHQVQSSISTRVLDHYTVIEQAVNTSSSTVWSTKEKASSGIMSICEKVQQTSLTSWTAFQALPRDVVVPGMLSTVKQVQEGMSKVSEMAYSYSEMGVSAGHTIMEKMSTMTGCTKGYVQETIANMTKSMQSVMRSNPISSN